jgi:hypothetical protein
MQLEFVTQQRDAVWIGGLEIEPQKLAVRESAFDRDFVKRSRGAVDQDQLSVHGDIVPMSQSAGMITRRYLLPAEAANTLPCDRRLTRSSRRSGGGPSCARGPRSRVVPASVLSRGH